MMQIHRHNLTQIMVNVIFAAFIHYVYRQIKYVISTENQNDFLKPIKGTEFFSTNVLSNTETN